MTASPHRIRGLAAAAAAALALFPACAGPPAEIQRSLETQSRWTRLYVEYANALIEKEGKAAKLSDGERHSKEEMLGVGERLARNAEALAVWGAGGNPEARGSRGENAR